MYVVRLFMFMSCGMYICTMVQKTILIGKHRHEFPVYTGFDTYKVLVLVIKPSDREFKAAKAVSAGRFARLNCLISLLKTLAQSFVFIIIQHVQGLKLL